MRLVSRQFWVTLKRLHRRKMGPAAQRGKPLCSKRALSVRRGAGAKLGLTAGAVCAVCLSGLFFGRDTIFVSRSGFGLCRVRLVLVFALVLGCVSCSEVTVLGAVDAVPGFVSRFVSPLPVPSSCFCVVFSAAFVSCSLLPFVTCSSACPCRVHFAIRDTFDCLTVSCSNSRPCHVQHLALLTGSPVVCLALCRVHPARSSWTRCKQQNAKNGHVSMSVNRWMGRWKNSQRNVLRFSAGALW